MFWTEQNFMHTCNWTCSAHCATHDTHDILYVKQLTMQSISIHFSQEERFIAPHTVTWLLQFISTNHGQVSWSMIRYGVYDPSVYCKQSVFIKSIFMTDIPLQIIWRHKNNSVWFIKTIDSHDEKFHEKRSWLVDKEKFDLKN